MDGLTLRREYHTSATLDEALAEAQAQPQQRRWRICYRDRSAFFLVESDSLWSVARIAWLAYRKMRTTERAIEDTPELG